MVDTPDWKKQIDSMKPNEVDKIKSDQRKQGRESRKERIKKKDDEYKEQKKKTLKMKHLKNTIRYNFDKNT